MTDFGPISVPAAISIYLWMGMACVLADFFYCFEGNIVAICFILLQVSTLLVGDLVACAFGLD